MSYFSVISSKDVTVPREIRVRLGLKEGDRLEFLIEGDRTVIRPARITENPFEKYAGTLATFPGGEEEINRWFDDMRSEDSEVR